MTIQDTDRSGTRPVELLAGSLPTPAGDVAVVAGTDGVVRAAGFVPLEEMVARWVAAAPAGTGAAARAALPRTVADAVTAYGDGDLDALGTVPVAQEGPPFLQEVWLTLRQVGPGRTVTYTELAALAGRPTAVRAAASGCARNLVALFVPCHRVLRRDGSPGGYAYGLPAKRALLEHERRG